MFCFVFLKKGNVHITAVTNNRKKGVFKAGLASALVGLLWLIIDLRRLFPIWVIVSVAALAL